MDATARRLFGSVGGRVRDLRVERGWTQDELAEDCGISRGSIANIERGAQAVGLLNLYRIADALGAELTDLIPQMDEVGDRVRATPGPKTASVIASLLNGEDAGE